QRALRRDQLACAAEEIPAFGRQLAGGATVTLEQLVTQVALHRLDLRADGWLADDETFGGLAEVAILGNGHEHFELAKRQSHNSPSVTGENRYLVGCASGYERRIANPVSRGNGYSSYLSYNLKVISLPKIYYITARTAIYRPIQDSGV